MTSLERRIQSLPDISPEDVKAACALAQQHPDLRKAFNCLIDLAQHLQDNKPREFNQRFSTLKQEFQFGNDMFGHIGTFFAHIGGAKSIVKAYTDLLDKVGWSHVTEELLYCGEDGGDGNEDDAAGGKSDIGQLRKYVLGLTDTSKKFACYLAESKLFNHLLEEVKNMRQSSFQSGSRVFYVSMGILYNCARHTELRSKFKDIAAVKIFLPMLGKKHSIVKLLTLLTLSYIIDEEDNDLLLAAGDDFDFLLRMIGQAWRAPDHRYWESLQTELLYFRLEELLQGLTNLARNEKNKKLLVQKGALDLLKPILRDGDDVEKHEATKALWQLAFDEENKSKMKKEPGILELLRHCKNDKHGGISSTADRIMWVLDMDKESHKEGQQQQSRVTEQRVDKIGETSKGSVDSSGHVMISYQWGNQQTLIKVRDFLRQRHFRVWMDIDHISGSTLQAMAEAVEGASVVLICMSQRYKDSPNCRMEAEYASKLKRTIVPLLMEAGYSPNGWLGILLGSKLYFDFSGKYPFDKKFKELVKEVGINGRLPESRLDSADKGALQVLPSPPPVNSVAHTIDISVWTKDDVLHWLSEIRLNGNSKLRKLSGKNLKFLQKLSKRAPEYYYTYLEKKLNLTDLDDLMNFSDAVEELP